MATCWAGMSGALLNGELNYQWNQQKDGCRSSMLPVTQRSFTEAAAV
jgi:hypothetical protein